MTIDNPGLEKIKIVVFGEADVGKTTLVSQISPKATSIEHSCRDGHRITVGFDIGKINIGGYMLYFFGTPGQTRFEFARQIVSQGAHIGILLIDSEAAGKRGIIDREKLMEQEMIDEGLPYLVCANKRDLEDIMPLENIQQHFKAPVLPIAAKTAQGMDSLTNALIDILEAHKETRQNSSFSKVAFAG